LSSAIQTIIEGDGEIRKIFRDTNWAETDLGPIDKWSEVLRLSVGLCLNSRFPLILWWGKELTMLYNDPYIQHLQSKHPAAFCRRGKDVWSEIWQVIGPMLEGVLTTGKPTWNDDLLLFLERNGFPEETYHTFSYSAITDQDGKIVGIFTPVAETTQRVIDERRMNTLAELARARSKTEEELLPKINAVLQTNTMDLPLCAFFSFEPGSATGKVLAASASNGMVAELNKKRLSNELRQSLASGETRTIDNLAAIISSLPVSVRGLPPEKALVVPVVAPQSSEQFVLFAALSPHQPLNNASIAFVESVSREIATALKEVRAYEQERRKAEALQELDLAKTVFFNNVSHEFRTPLTLMLGPVERLLSRVIDTDDRSELESLHRNALRLLKLVNTLLDFSRIEAGRYEAHFEPTNLSTFTADLASLFRSAIEEAKLTFDVDCQASTEEAYIDKEMWEKIVLNLLSNAFKFTSQGKISISVSQTDKTFNLKVTDTGIGIATEDQPNLFKRFHRLKAEGARTYEGTGIGLAMVHELVRLHGGSISVKSETNVGTEFLVQIPRGYKHLPAAQVFHQESQHKTNYAATFVQEASSWLHRTSSQITTTDGSRKTTQTILVADDNADMRDYLQRLLSPIWSVALVSNGRQALAALETDPPDLLITDIMMPELDGLALLQEVRSSTRLCSIPVLLLSARAGEEDRARGLEAGADEYLVKPFSARELYARVARLLEQRLFSHTLETAIAERTKELTAALEAKSRFLSTLSHEVRTPMAGVIGVVELIQVNSKQDENIHELAKVAFDSCKRLLQILNDMLDASKLQAGALQLESRRFAVRPVIGDLVQLTIPETHRKGLEIISNVDADVPDTVCGDELRVRQVLQNLVFNAVKFTHQGKVSIHVLVERHKEKSTTLKFVVTDSGIGISAENQERIFEPFHQAEASTTRVYGGTGLGLSIARTLIELMGGQISLRSEPGKGSTFSVSIPFEDDLCDGN
jgi:signal transduction histidine kinase